MNAITATITAVIMMVIGMVVLLLFVTKKAYSHQWNPEDHNSTSSHNQQEDSSV